MANATHKTPTKYDPELKARLVGEVLGGKSLKEVGKSHGIHPSVIARWRDLAQGKTPSDTKSRPPKTKPKAKAEPKPKVNLRVTNRLMVSDKDKAAAVAAYEAGGNAKELAERYGVTDASIYLWRKSGKHGGTYAKHGNLAKKRALVDSLAANVKREKRVEGRALVVVNGRGRDVPSVEFHIQHEVIGLLANAERSALARGRPTKAELLAMVALRTLKGE